jgi:predicted HTH domain antitoxin
LWNPKETPLSSTVHIEIPQDVLDSARLTVDQLLVELAVHLYEQSRLSVGKAHELAGLSLWEFRQLLGFRQVAPHFALDDLAQDLETLRLPAAQPFPGQRMK